MKEYLDRIASADSLDDLDLITEEAANNDTLTNAEYESIYSAGLAKAQEWRGF